MAAATLTAGDMELLEFERATWKYPGNRDAAVLERFGLSRTAYLQRLLALVEHPAAAAYDPLVVGQIRRRLDHARATRAGAAP